MDADRQDGAKRAAGRHTKRLPLWLVMLLALAGLAIVVGALWYRQYDMRGWAVYRGFQLQVAVEKWDADAEFVVPATLDEVIQQGYLASMPINPYTGQPMRCIAWGDPPTRGDVTYLRVYTTKSTPTDEWYAIIVYGPKG